MLLNRRGFHRYYRTIQASGPRTQVTLWVGSHRQQVRDVRRCLVFHSSVIASHPETENLAGFYIQRQHTLQCSTIPHLQSTVADQERLSPPLLPPPAKNQNKLMHLVRDERVRIAEWVQALALIVPDLVPAVFKAGNLA